MKFHLKITPLCLPSCLIKKAMFLKPILYKKLFWKNNHHLLYQ